MEIFSRPNSASRQYASVQIDSTLAKYWLFNEVIDGRQKPGKPDRQRELYRPFANLATSSVFFSHTKSLVPVFGVSQMSHTQPFFHMIMRRLPLILAGFVASFVCAASGYAQQVVYYSPVVAQPSPYVARYTPSGTYSAVTAYSPQVATAVPTSSVAVPGYYAPAATTAYYAPTTTYYAPTAAYYAPTTTYYAPTSAYYAPTAYVTPYYRRGLFGRYRPARAVVYPAY